MQVPDVARPYFRLLEAILDVHRSQRLLKTSSWEYEGISVIRAKLHPEWVWYLDLKITQRKKLRDALQRAYGERREKEVVRRNEKKSADLMARGLTPSSHSGSTGD